MSSPTAKTRIFIGSSQEALPIVDALTSRLSRNGFIVDDWRGDVFTITKSNMESLSLSLGKADFGVFVFHPDDKLEFRGEEVTATRDNVVLEYGMYLGRLGPERTIGVAPDDENHKLPPDTAGLSFATYDPELVGGVDTDSAFLSGVVAEISRHVRDVMANFRSDGPTSSDDEVPMCQCDKGPTQPPLNLQHPGDGWSYMLDRGLLQPIGTESEIGLGKVVIHALHGAGRVVGFDPQSLGGSLQVKFAEGSGFYSLQTGVLFLPPV